MVLEYMSNQIFRIEPPIELVNDLLDKICENLDSQENQQIKKVDIHAYRRMKYHDYHKEFLSSLFSYYHWSKHFYLERELTYYSFMTILRQVYRLHHKEVVRRNKEYYIHI